MPPRSGSCSTDTASFITYFQGIAGPQRGILAPEALNRFYLDPPVPGGAPAAERRVGTTWMTREDRDAEIADYVAYLDQVCADLAPRAERVTVLGFSQGVATACRWIASGRTPVTRLIAWAGQLAPDVDVRVLAARVAQPLDVVVGDADEYAAARALDSELARLDEAGVTYRLTRFAGGHRMDKSALLTFTSDL
jgi:predicted esterase